MNNSSKYSKHDRKISISNIDIKGWMITELNLSGNELLLYAIIFSFSSDGQSKYFGSLRYLEAWLRCTRPTVIKAIKNLVQKELIYKDELEINGVKSNSYYVNFDNIPTINGGGKEILPPVKKFNRGGKEILQGVVKKFNRGGKKTLHNNNIDNNIIYNNNYNIQEEPLKNFSQEKNEDFTGEQTLKNHEKEKEKKVALKKEKTLAEREKEFGEEVSKFKDKYPLEIIREFYDYWTEPNRTKTKMKFEQEKTWDTSRRIARWFKNSRNWNKQSKQDTLNPSSSRTTIKDFLS